MRSLQQVRTTLQAALANDSLFVLVSTRVTLRTGVDLRSIEPKDNEDEQVVGKVLEALTALGFPPKNLEVVAQKNAAS